MEAKRAMTSPTFSWALPANYNQCSQQFLDSRTRYGGAYGEDTWKVKSNITLNLGNALGISMPWYDTQGKIETIVPGLQSTHSQPHLLDGLFPEIRNSKHTRPNALQTISLLAWVLHILPALRWGIRQDLWRTWQDKHPRGLRHLLHFDRGSELVLRSRRRAIRSVLVLAGTDDVPTSPSVPAPREPRRHSGFHHVPDPGDPANKTLDYSIYLPISFSPGYDIHNRMPYAEHYNLSIQRELSKSTVLTLAYVGTQGHKLIAQYDANPGDAALCLQLRQSVQHLNATATERHNLHAS